AKTLHLVADSSPQHDMLRTTKMGFTPHKSLDSRFATRHGGVRHHNSVAQLLLSKLLRTMGNTRRNALYIPGNAPVDTHVTPTGRTRARSAGQPRPAA